ncbi:hypothetical protein PAPYR_5437 [Paratrimastix pyriformis]|uniref:Uncharacterized protein n=1 Tax=Paratrimastix pyriformis TaxID=342808 RepID=A0ABQ8UIR5_9EUKA|nr:hypothetical protein PAPYR_5437 [Paratrimastix pyriformis]
MDPTYEEYCTPAKEDEVFGAMRIAERLKNPRAMRCVMVIPYESGMPNKDGVETGVDIIRRAIVKEKVDAVVREIAVFEAGTFKFWRANFWKDGVRGTGNAPWAVGVVMVENAACEEKYPVDGEAFVKMKEMMTKLYYYGKGSSEESGEETRVSL